MHLLQELGLDGLAHRQHPPAVVAVHPQSLARSEIIVNRQHIGHAEGAGQPSPGVLHPPRLHVNQIRAALFQLLPDHPQHHPPPHGHAQVRINADGQRLPQRGRDVVGVGRDDPGQDAELFEMLHQPQRVSTGTADLKPIREQHNV